MPEQYGFSDYATEPSRLCQSNKGGDQMNQKDDEVAHCANDIKTRQALDLWPIFGIRHRQVMVSGCGLSVPVRFSSSIFWSGWLRFAIKPAAPYVIIIM